MHIEPGLVTGPKLMLGYLTSAAVAAYGLKLCIDEVRNGRALPLLARAGITTALVFCFFEVLPHFPVGVSEVHFILGATLYLVFGAAATAIGLALGLLIQGLFFEPQDLAQYGMNVTTLLVPLFAMAFMARRLIPDNTPYVDLRYAQALSLSASYQAGVVAWVAFWAAFGGGVGAANLQSIGLFATAYLPILAIEPLFDLIILAAARAGAGLVTARYANPRLFLHAS